ncbi:MAG: host-nuclease inhibitor Gam family protein [Bacteroidota bacterium]
MIEQKSPDWLQELLDAEEEKEKHQLIEMSKIKADQALAAISVIEAKINEVNDIAEKEISLIQNWNMSEVAKLQKKIDWLVWNMQNWMQSTGEKTISLPHGKIAFRMGRDRYEVVDLPRFLPIGQKLGLVRVTPAKTEPDLIAIANYTKLNGGKPPVGIMRTPAQSHFSYKTKGTNDVEYERNDEQAQAGAIAGNSNQAHAA